MYQFYYAQGIAKDVPEFKLNIADRFDIKAVRPAMWEEHCLECSAPLCFNNCVHYSARSDGRCKRFENGLLVYDNEKGCSGEGMRVEFRPWANMMTVLFPAMLSNKDYATLTKKNKKLGKLIRYFVESKLPVSLRWNFIRTIEFIRRRGLRKMTGLENTPDAFVFHGYSHYPENFNLIIEVYDDHSSVYKTAITLKPGENLAVLTELSAECAKAGNLVKIYPENDIQATLDILWCDFVKGTAVAADKPADKVKCLVWDLDNTLWNGILIETDNPDTLELKQGVEDTIKELDARGILMSVASKNDYTGAWQVIERLGLAEYFLYPQIHWNPKSGSMQAIASNLNIGIDSLALIDDSVFERKEVCTSLPMVRTYDVTELDKLLALPEFCVPVTDESRRRREMYRAEEKRKILQASAASDPVEFLRKCNITIDIFEPATEEEKLRCYELVVRTNQLNMSGIKYTPEEFEKVISREGHRNFAVSCKDDFGSYGIVCFGQYKVEDDTLIFTEFAMSCRVAGKYAESALFTRLLKRENCRKGRFDIIKTKKNTLLRNTLSDIGFLICKESEDELHLEFSKELKNNTVVHITE